MKNILTSRATLSMILLLLLLPALYAWINIQAGWDPYLNTKGLSVAVVNLDSGSELRNVKVNIGNDVIKNLKTNQSIGWTFVSESEAQKGIKYGKYYASLTVPKDFSKDLLSVATSSNPTKAKLIYTVNEKRNAISPKITGKGATSLQEEITKTFIETASGTIFSFLTQVGVELEKNKPQVESVIDIMVSLDDKMPKIKKSLDNIYGQSVMFQTYMHKVQGDIPTISNELNNVLDITKTSNSYIEKSRDSLKAVSPIVKEDLSLIKDITDNAESSLTKVQDLTPANDALMKDVLIKVRDQYRDGMQTIDNVSSLNKSMNNFLNSAVIDTLIDNLSSVRNEMANQQNDINSMISTLDRGNSVLTSDISAAMRGANKTSKSMNNLTDKFDTTIDPKIDDALKNITKLSNNAVVMLQGVQDNMPTVNKLLGETVNKVDSKVNSLKKIKDSFPKTQENMHLNAEKLKSLTSDEKLNDIILMLKKDGKKESDFLSSPINLKQNSIYPIPNYGSAMSAFYTTLAIWVGALIMFSFLSVEVKEFEGGIPINTREKFLGRYFTLLSIGIVQALVTIGGNLFLLKTYAVSPIILTLFGVYVSIVFITLMYATVCIFGNIGKALIVVVMVLQISASGGTFPVELLGTFSQYIHPMLPFTYAIGGMREAIAGIIPEVLMNNVVTLGKYFVVSLLLGLLLQERMTKITSHSARQFNESGLAE
ncbi:YhgE/Pip domain-containing protein [Clostridium tagluense]|uniref:YhgE/Pip domain-containing protein n=1 Tax=Clostridium tagluense TaxID=360422 RepID=UPI001C6DFF60|nr:YhgE/Pip domain-containing protein [Clostridium tagluense]MBW9156962.1 YhgE/Pip domain-containing protein [Clostridium tagluense]WLC64949.1 YhgE/Pip domain-containing protein [Clostridium tagluense]